MSQRHSQLKAKGKSEVFTNVSRNIPRHELLRARWSQPNLRLSPLSAGDDPDLCITRKAGCVRPPAGHWTGDCTQSLIYAQSLIRSLYTQSFVHSPSQDTVTHGGAGKEKERKRRIDTISQSPSLTAPHTHTVHLSSPLQSVTCSTHSPSWTQSLAHSQSPTHCPLQSCQLSCNRNRMSDLSEEEERFV